MDKFLILIQNNKFMVYDEGESQFLKKREKRSLHGMKISGTGL
jgi:hypothetical protein